eukprot:12892209-Prorocentrum_lima.AAC.1
MDTQYQTTTGEKVGPDQATGQAHTSHLWSVPRASPGRWPPSAIGRTGQDKIPLPASDLFGHGMGLS